ncbi:hypothetical protein BRD56_03780 [Thermoplasmatales archaeon SW_10_69_26]|nr:MAG: hypothetical protein BRD56_03780 [Thermoplasmatales archaeon SW_10_69_26]
MFPFHSRLGWHAKTGYLHLVEAIDDHMQDFASPYSEVLEQRAESLRLAVRVRLFVILLLNIGFIVTAAAWIASVLPPLAGVRELTQRLARATTGITVVFTGLFVIISRYLGQLQADIIAAIALGTGWQEDSAAQRQKLIERAAEETGDWSEDLDVGVKEEVEKDELEQTTLGKPEIVDGGDGDG